MELLEMLKSAVDYIGQAPVSVLLVIALNLLAVGLHKWPRFPDHFIGLSLVLIGSVVMMAVGPLPASRSPHVVLGLTGLIYGCLSWFFHPKVAALVDRFTGSKDAKQPDPPASDPMSRRGQDHDGIDFK